jgi:hypothetical protein
MAIQRETSLLDRKHQSPLGMLPDNKSFATCSVYPAPIGVEITTKFRFVKFRFVSMVQSAFGI